MKQFASVLLMGCFVILGLISISSAQDTTFIEMNYQGYLTDSDGTPLDGTYDFTFTFRDTIFPRWQETQLGVPVEGGYFEVILGTITPLPLPVLAMDSTGMLEPIYLQLSVDGETIGPPTKLTSAPYAGVATRMRGDVFTGPGYLQVGDDENYWRISTVDRTTFFGSNYGEPDESGIVMYLGPANDYGLGIFDQGDTGFVAGPNNLQVGTGGEEPWLFVDTDDSTFFFGTNYGELDEAGVTFYGRGDADMSGNVAIAGTLSIGNSIDIDGDNDIITATSGTIGFDDENLTTTGQISMGAFKMETGASNGFVLTSDANGVGTWLAAGAGDADWYFRITDGADTTLTTGGEWGITRYGNVLYGNKDSTHVNLGVFSITGTNGQNQDYCTVAGGLHNVASVQGAFVGGGQDNTASGSNAAIVGGLGNNASGTDGPTVGGGTYNTAGGDYYATVGGGGYNQATGEYYPTVAGGYENIAAGDYSAILGGYSNNISAAGDYSYLFGINSDLTQDSTFMVDMPHIRFGDETDGYEFPTDDGSSGQVMATDGSGQLSWTDAPLDNDWTFRVTDGADTTLMTGGAWGIARYGNTLYGNKDSTHVNLGVSCTTGANGQNQDYCTVAGGRANTASGNRAAVGGGTDNTASGWNATVAGGWSNVASGDNAPTIGGGGRNTASADYYPTVTGGYQNVVAGDYSAILGGYSNEITATGDYSYLFGINSDLTEDSTFMVDMPHIRFGDETDGYEFPADDGSSGQVLKTDGNGQLSWDSPDDHWTFRVTDGADTTLMMGGRWGIARYGNVLYGSYDSTHVNLGTNSTTGTAGQDYRSITIGGGAGNLAAHQYATVSGGVSNESIGGYSAVGGGSNNRAEGSSATVAGGASNSAKDDWTTVGGGVQNKAEGSNSTVAGGWNNHATAYCATIAAGRGNDASADYATVGGGMHNVASGYASTVPGGYQDTTAGDYSLASGYRVKVASSGDFTFAFGYDFSTASPNAVVFCHNTGNFDSTKVGINKTNPLYSVDLPNVNSQFGKGRAYAWTTYSSRRLKENVRPIDDALEKVMQLEGVYFDWKESKEEDIGMVAEDVGEILPQLVTYEKNGVDAQTLDYARLTALLVEAVKEQQKEIKALKEEINAVKGGNR